MEAELLVPVEVVAELTPGDWVGRWQIEGELGRGGMSTVYAVIHGEIGKRAALKVVHRHLLTAGFPAEQVLAEARMVNQIAHSNVVDIFENGLLPDGRPFLVMERLDGWSLGQRLQASRMSTDEVISILLQICDALTASHAAGIVHCDLKPENVFLVDGVQGPRTRVKVLDWGIASAVAPHTGPRRPEDVNGTPRYASPEQVAGGWPTPASDIYSLGVMAYELFLEEQPFNSDSTAEILNMQLNVAPPDPETVWPGIPPALTHLLLAMLAKPPTSRPVAAEVAVELASIRSQLRERSEALTRSEAAAMRASALALTSMSQRPVSRAIEPMRSAPIASRWLESRCGMLAVLSSVALLVAIAIVLVPGAHPAVAVVEAASLAASGDVRTKVLGAASTAVPPSPAPAPSVAIAIPSTCTELVGVAAARGKALRGRSTGEPRTAAAIARGQLGTADPRGLVDRPMDPNGTIEAY